MRYFTLKTDAFSCGSTRFACHTDITNLMLIVSIVAGIFSFKIIFRLFFLLSFDFYKKKLEIRTIWKHRNQLLPILSKSNQKLGDMSWSFNDTSKRLNLVLWIQNENRSKLNEWILCRVESAHHTYILYMSIHISLFLYIYIVCYTLNCSVKGIMSLGMDVPGTNVNCVWVQIEKKILIAFRQTTCILHTHTHKERERHSCARTHTLHGCFNPYKSVVFECLKWSVFISKRLSRRLSTI